jgi:hypothetical protein
VARGGWEVCVRDAGGFCLHLRLLRVFLILILILILVPALVRILVLIRVLVLTVLRS